MPRALVGFGKGVCAPDSFYLSGRGNAAHNHSDVRGPMEPTDPAVAMDEMPFGIWVLTGVQGWG